MLEPLDIFRMQKDGTYEWKAMAASLELAKWKVKQLAMKTPGAYVIFSQITGQKTVIPLDSGTTT